MGTLVTVITPTYNSQKFIRQTYESLFKQSYKEWEWIVVDDCSNDDTLKILETISLLDIRVRVYSNTVNSGAAVSRNKAIEVAKGDFIAFLDSDDMWLDTKLETQLKFMMANDVAFSYMPYQVVNEFGNKVGARSVPSRLNYTDLLKKPSIGCLTAMYSVKFLGKRYMPRIRKRQDLGLWLSILKTIDYAYAVDYELAQYRVHSGSISSNKISAAQFTWNLYRNVEKMGLFKSIYYFSFYALNSLKTYSIQKFKSD